jgi:transcriptional regulator
MDYVDKLKTYRTRNRRWLKLRAQGWTLQKIADHFGVTRARVHQVVERDRRDSAVQ